MRVLFLVQPADGHLNPLLGLSAALRAAGHDVTFVSSPKFVHRIEARGEHAVELGRSWLEADGPSQGPLPGDEEVRAGAFFQRFFLREVAQEMAIELEAFIARDRPDLIVREPTEYGSALVGEKHGIPVVTVEFAFPMNHAEIAKHGTLTEDDEFARLRAWFGLPPTDDVDWFIGDLQLVGVPDSYRLGIETRPGHRLMRPHALGVADDAVVPPWVDELERAIYVTFGTVFASFASGPLGSAIEGAARLGRPTVATLGNAVQEFVAPNAPNLRVERYVPQGPVLDRCVAALVHGGSGSTLGALARGIPLVVVPFGADQPDHARAVEQAGAGIRLHPATLTADAVQEALRVVTTEPSYTDAARALSVEFAAMPGPEAIVGHLEELVG